MKGKVKTHCKLGHEFTPENTYIHKKSGIRACRLCRGIRDQQSIRDPIKMRKWRKEWRERNPDYHKNNWLMRAYGISLEDLREMLVNQGGYCAICGNEFCGDKDCHVDHDHLTGKIRSILCTNCNHGLGMFQDSPRILLAAMSYLEEH